MTTATEEVVVPPGAERAPVRIAHLGLGAFHRAHQAWYTEAANRIARQNGDAEWGIAAFTGRRPDAARALAAEDCRYDLVVRAADGDTIEPIESIVAAHDGADAAAWRAALADVAIVTLTVTERGYHRDAAQEAKDLADLAAGDLPASATGRLVDGLRARREADGGPIAIVSCDNLDGNGEILRARVAALAAAADAELADWIAQNASFVSTMVDRITPATDAAQLAGVTADPGAVVTEPAATWVLAGDFPAGRPAWELAGAIFVDDIAPYEQRKLWLLNAGHTLLASLGQLRGHTSVAEAMGDPVCADAVERLWDDATSVLPFSIAEVLTERRIIASRFENPRIRHALAQIAADTEVKLGVRVIPVIEERRRRGWDAGRGALAAIAAWAEAVSNGIVDGPALAQDADGAAVAALAVLSPTLAADRDVRAQLIEVAQQLRGDVR